MPPRSLYPDTPAPAGLLDGSFEVGTRFEDSAGGLVTALRFVRATSEPNVAHTLRLWDAGGTEVAEAVAPAAAAGTWAVATLDEPYELTPDVTYTVSVSITNQLVVGGDEPAGEGTLAPLPANPGVFHDPPLGQFPDSTVGGHYWVDVLVEDDVGDTEPPSSPASLSAAAVSATGIALNWAAATDNVAVSHYLLERCQGAACTGFVQIAAPSGTSYNNTGLTASTLYRYRVRAVDTSDNPGDYSPVAEATTFEAGVGPPSGSLADLMDEMANKLLAVVGPASADTEVQVAGRLNPNPTPPSIDIYPGNPFRDTTTAAFTDVGGELLFTVRARVTTVDNIAGQNLLLRLMDDEDPISVAAALMEDQTLNGLASSVYVEGNSGYTRYLDGGADSGGLLGSEWRVRVLRVTS